MVVYEELLALVPNEAYKTYLYTHLVCSVHESKQTAMESRLIRFDKDFDTACIKRYTTSPSQDPSFRTRDTNTETGTLRRALEQVVQAEAALAKAVRDSMSIKATGRERNNQVVRPNYDVDQVFGEIHSTNYRSNFLVSSTCVHMQQIYTTRVLSARRELRTFTIRKECLRLWRPAIMLRF